MFRGWVCGALLGLAYASAAVASEANSYNAKFSLGYHYSSGSYGGTDTTEIAYVPFLARAGFGPWSATITVPYLRISGPPVVIDGIQTVGGESDGLGDILARASYTVLPRAEWMPFIDLITRLKFPTASRGDGLGTGEFDYGFEVEFSQTIDRFTPFIMGGYRILGSPPDSNLRNVAVASAGGTYRALDSVNLGLFVDYREAASAQSGTRLDLVPFLSWKITSHWSVDVYATAGLADGSPDVGTGMQLGWSL